MLQVRDLVKKVPDGDGAVLALQGVTLAFRECELAFVTGGEGNGKSTLLHLLGGQEQADGGELLVGGVSTLRYTPADWDAYRCRTASFVFPRENLIGRETLLSNLELAAAVAGLPARQCRRRAAELLRYVGLTEQARCRPEQLTAAQRQKAWLAKALMNDPDVLLVDEPALGGESGSALLASLREIAQNRLVIVATANAAAAAESGGRVIELRQGAVAADSAPFTPNAIQRPTRRGEKPSLGVMAALRLSLGQQAKHRGRTALVTAAAALAAAALTLAFALFLGTDSYLARLEGDALAATPITVTASANTATLTQTLDAIGVSASHGRDAVYARATLSAVRATVSSYKTRANDLETLAAYLAGGENGAGEYLRELRRLYDTPPEIYASDTSGGLRQVSPSAVLDGVLGANSGVEIWRELPADTTELQRRYEIAAGRWPRKESELVLIMDADNEVSDVLLCALGLADPDALPESGQRWNYEEILAITYRLLLPTDYYRQGADGLWAWAGGDADLMKNAVANALQLHVVGIIRPIDGAVLGTLGGAMGYPAALRAYISEQVEQSAVVTAQRQTPQQDIFTGLPFAQGSVQTLGEQEKSDALVNYALSLPATEQAELYKKFNGVTDENSLAAGQAAAMAEDGSIAWALHRYLENKTTAERAALYEDYCAVAVAPTTLEENLRTLGTAGGGTLTALELYATDLPARARLTEQLNAYNRRMSESGRPDEAVAFTDSAAAAVTALAGTASALSFARWAACAMAALLFLCAFLALGMAGVACALERRREGVLLRAMGVPQSGLRRALRADTVWPGLLAGLLGVGVAWLTIRPVNAVSQHFFGFAALSPLLWWQAAALFAVCAAAALLASVAAARTAAGHKSTRE